MAKTSLAADYLGRDIVEGTSDTDYLGRLVADPDDPDDPLVVNEVDFLGRELSA